MNVNRFEAARELLGHDIQVREIRVNGTTRHWWVECDCGYRTEPGPSWKFHTSAAIGHAKRVADRLRAENAGVSLPAAVSDAG